MFWFNYLLLCLYYIIIIIFFFHFQIAVRSGIHLAGEAEKFFNPPQPVSPERRIQKKRIPGIKFVQSSEKLKLQLFPIDGNIRKGLEKVHLCHGVYDI